MWACDTIAFSVAAVAIYALNGEVSCSTSSRMRVGGVENLPLEIWLRGWWLRSLKLRMEIRLWLRGGMDGVIVVGVAWVSTLVLLVLAILHLWSLLLLTRARRLLHLRVGIIIIRTIRDKTRPQHRSLEILSDLNLHITQISLSRRSLPFLLRGVLGFWSPRRAAFKAAVPVMTNEGLALVFLGGAVGVYVVNVWEVCVVPIGKLVSFCSSARSVKEGA